MGLKPKANLLISGNTEPNCNSNFSVTQKAIPLNKIFKKADICGLMVNIDFDNLINLIHAII